IPSNLPNAIPTQIIPNPTAAPALNSPQAASNANAAPAATNNNSPPNSPQFTVMPTSAVVTSVGSTVATVFNSQQSSLQLTTYSVTSVYTTSFLVSKQIEILTGTFNYPKNTPTSTSDKANGNKDGSDDSSDSSHIIGPILGAITATASLAFIIALVLIRRKRCTSGHYKLNDDFDSGEFNVHDDDILKQPEMAHIDTYSDIIDLGYGSSNSSDGGTGAA
ncbi:5107_t:CDS:1, partial [Racocetra persica]